MATRLTKKIRERIWKLHYEGYFNHQIAEIVGITEYQVNKVLRRR